VPISYELTPANTADLCLSKELLAEADLGGEVARKLLGETLATTLVGLVSRIAAKITAYTYAFVVNRVLNRSQGRIKELWGMRT